MKISKNYKFQIPEFGDPADIRVVGESIESIDEKIHDREVEHKSHREAVVLDHPDGSVTTEKVHDRAIVSQKIGKGEVVNENLAENSVWEAQLGSQAVTNDKIANGAVSHNKIEDGAVITAKLFDGAVTNEKIAGDSITHDKLRSNSVWNNHLGEAAVTSEKIAQGAVTNEKISNVDASKITSGVIDIARIPPAALERLTKVANKAARFALTKDIVQKGDTVQELDSGLMYIVIDDSKLSSDDGYAKYTAGRAASVAWTGVTGKPDTFPPNKHTHEIKDVELLDDRFNSSKSIRVFNTNPDDLHVATFRDYTNYVSADSDIDRTLVPDAAGYVLNTIVNPLTWARGVEWQYSDQIVLNIDDVDYNDSDQYLIITYDFNTSKCNAEFSINQSEYNKLPTYGAGIMMIKGGRWQFDFNTSKWINFPENIINPGDIVFPYGYGTWVDPFIVSDPETDLSTLTTPGIYYFDFEAESPIIKDGEEELFISHCYMTVQPANDKNNHRHIIQKIKMYVVSTNEDVYEIEREVVNGIPSDWYILRGPINSYVNMNYLINRVTALENAIKSLTGNSADGTIDENTTLTAATDADAENVLKKYFS